jgi:hypothetical protein
MVEMVDIPGKGQMPRSQLRIGWLWNTPEKFNFHWVVKDILRKQLTAKNIDLKLIYEMMKVNRSWIEVRDGEVCPANYPMLLFIWKRYIAQYRKFKPPLLYRLAIEKLGIVALTLFKEDVAYTSRMGGVIQYIYENEEEWKIKENRPLLLRDLLAWWEEEDWREYSKDFLRGAFEFIIEKYDTEPFVQKTVDYWIDNLLANKKNWYDGDGFFTPEKWYPRGTGQINYIVHGRKA